MSHHNLKDLPSDFAKTAAVLKLVTLSLQVVLCCEEKETLLSHYHPMIGRKEHKIEHVINECPNTYKTRNKHVINRYLAVWSSGAN